HDFEPLLAKHFLEVGPPACRDLIETLRKSIIEHIKIDFAEQGAVRGVSGRRRSRDSLSVYRVGRQFRFVDMDDRVECIKNERAILHGSIGKAVPTTA